MPGLVRRMIAKPRMRKRSYLMWLDEDGAATAQFPSEEGLPTVLFLLELRVLRVEHPATSGALRSAVGSAAP